MAKISISIPQSFIILYFICCTNITNNKREKILKYNAQTNYENNVQINFDTVTFNICFNFGKKL